MMPSKIHTRRLTLRQYVESDSQALLGASARNREHLREYEADNAILSVTDVNSASMLVRELAADWKEGEHFFIGMFCEETGKWIGQIYVGKGNPSVPEYRIGYIVDHEHEGEGYVTEAVSRIVEILFEQLAAHKISIECDDANVRSVAVAERCGFLREGHLRDTKVHSDGRRTGTLLYGLMKM